MRGLLDFLAVHPQAILTASERVADMERRGELHRDLAVLPILLDSLADFIRLNSRKCDREDCSSTFVKTAYQKRFFCSPRCAHMVAIRNFRKRNDITSGHPTHEARA
jgi:hypothetical protein